jgi:hypothetical protein
MVFRAVTISVCSIIGFVVPAIAQNGLTDNRWVSIYEDEEKSVDLDTRRSEGLNGGRPAAWLRWTFGEEQAINGVRYVIMFDRSTYDCRNFAIRSESATYHDQEGKMVDGWDNPLSYSGLSEYGEWSSVRPGSVGEYLLEEVCAYAQTQGR